MQKAIRHLVRPLLISLGLAGVVCGTFLTVNPTLTTAATAVSLVISFFLMLAIVLCEAVTIIFKRPYKIQERKNLIYKALSSIKNRYESELEPDVLALIDRALLQRQREIVNAQPLGSEIEKELQTATEEITRLNRVIEDLKKQLDKSQDGEKKYRAAYERVTALNEFGIPENVENVFSKSEIKELLSLGNSKTPEITILIWLSSKCELCIDHFIEYGIDQNLVFECREGLVKSGKIQLTAKAFMRYVVRYLMSGTSIESTDEKLIDSLASQATRDISSQRLYSNFLSSDQVQRFEKKIREYPRGY